MKIILEGKSALEAWHRHDVPASSDGAYVCVPSDCAPCKKSLDYLLANHDYLTAPVHLVVPDKRDARKLAFTKQHVPDSRAHARRYYKIDSGVYVVEPKVAFLQAAREVSLACLVRFAYMLAAKYRLADDTESGLCSREPLVSVVHLRKYLNSLEGAFGLRAAKRAASMALDGAASPKEIELAVKLCSPAAIGGCAATAEPPHLNLCVNPGFKGKRHAKAKYYVCDIAWRRAKLVLEYDSNYAHLTPAQKNHDEAKRQSLEADGYKVISVVPAHLASVDEFNRVAEQTRRHLGMRAKLRAQNFEAAQEALFREFLEYDM